MSHVKTDEALLQVRGLKKHFGHLEVLRGIDIDIHKGEVVAVIGPSGSGKSQAAVTGAEAEAQESAEAQETTEADEPAETADADEPAETADADAGGGADSGDADAEDDD